MPVIESQYGWTNGFETEFGTFATCPFISGLYKLESLMDGALRRTSYIRNRVTEGQI
jgi:hypothetical protein